MVFLSLKSRNRKTKITPPSLRRCNVGLTESRMTVRCRVESFSGIPERNYNTGWGIIVHERHEHTRFMHHWRELCEGGGRDEDSPATIYLIWLSWLHSRRPELLDAEAGRGRGREAGKHGPAERLPRFPFCASTNWTWQLKKNTYTYQPFWTNLWFSHPLDLLGSFCKKVLITDQRNLFITLQNFSRECWCHTEENQQNSHCTLA